MVIIGFSFIFFYLLTMYLNADFNLPFPIFPQGLMVNGMASAVICGVFGAAVVDRVFRVLLKSNILQLGSTLDSVNTDAVHTPFDQLAWTLNSHATMVTIKEIYGLLCIVAVVFILAFLLMRSTLRPSVFHPKWSTVRKLFKRSVKS